MTNTTVPNEESEPVVEEQYTRTATTPVDAATEAPARSGFDLAINIIWYLTGLLMILLSIRFILALFGANPSNAFADLIYTITYPFVAPFFDLFGYTRTYGVSRFEGFTLVAMLVYLLVVWGIVKLLTIIHDR